MVFFLFRAELNARCHAPFLLHNLQNSQPKHHADLLTSGHESAVFQELASPCDSANECAARSSPLPRVRFLPENNVHMRVLTEDEEQRYLASASKLLHDFATVMLETGVRSGELAAARVRDFDRTLGALYIRTGKTRFAKRYIPLTRGALLILDEARECLPHT